MDPSAIVVDGDAVAVADAMIVRRLLGRLALAQLQDLVTLWGYPQWRNESRRRRLLDSLMHELVRRRAATARALVTDCSASS